MEAIVELGSHAVVGTAAAQPLTPIELLRIPEELDGETVYVAGIYGDFSVTSSANAGGAITPEEWHNHLNEFSITDGRYPWGPDKLTGSQLAALRYMWTGQAISLQSDANGDANAAAAANRASRWVFGYEYRALGQKDSDFCPPAAVLNKGFILSKANGFSTNETAYGATITYTAHVMTAGEKRAIPRLVTRFNVLVGLNAVAPFSGKLAHLAIQKPGAAWSRAEMTNVRIYDSKGEFVNYSPQDMNLTNFPINPEVTSQRVQRHFCETNQGSFPRFVPLYPFNQGDVRRMSITDMPDSNSYRLLIAGTLTPGNAQLVYTMVERMQPSDIVSQLARCGCDRSKLNEAASGGLSQIGFYKTHSKMPLRDADHVGYLPFKLDPTRAAVKASGLASGLTGIRGS